MAEQPPPPGPVRTGTAPDHPAASARRRSPHPRLPPRHRPPTAMRRHGVSIAVALPCVAAALPVVVALCAVVVLCAAPVAWALDPDAPSTDGWVWPLAGASPGGRPGQPHGAGRWSQVTHPFDPPDTPYGVGHRGVDLAGHPGEQVVAAGSGVVTYAAVLAGRGVVAVTHPGGMRTTYEPVRAVVTAGQRVRAGEVLGTLLSGHSGCPGEVACLHWGLLRGHDYLDPIGLLRDGPVRLLPVPRRRHGGGARRAAVTDRSQGLHPRPPRAGPVHPGRTVGYTAAGLALLGAGLAARPRPP